jgi:hypothetical protein
VLYSLTVETVGVSDWPMHACSDKQAKMTA